ncbi:hypothetical protein PUNSTDRAFT_52038 [Punctularia strigosozonata HHB-11173 SS5]|uniref:uncharacterized protein n=1 Tax=Punctularia strigosozonata (strain HHB-11173) TaxID=741275 RepID=UPI0004417AB0|nr:uncharacterized protein PUNSTDRAFT_52038 [Punctularia strigosozonata HHB-11173 SS5]EIN09866.1 hypothetical protein PUNSTDRAFT_52038 [Punctularia strigosozonata HHB-11173 SS5]
MRSFAILSVVLGASAALATPFVSRQDANTSDVFRFLGGVYCLLTAEQAAVQPNGPCDPAIQVPLPLDANGSNFTEVEGHAVNVTLRDDVFGPFVGYDVSIDDVLRGDRLLFGAGITRSYDIPLEK